MPLSDLFRDLLPSEAIQENVPMRLFTTMRVGGPADVMLSPATEASLSAVLDRIRQENIPWLIVGNGSNLLVSDDGFRGVVLHIGKNYGSVTCESSRIFAQSGAMLSAVARLAEENSLTGLEFASGIPGSVGGGVYMNAGAYGGEIGQVLSKARVWNHGEIQEWEVERFAFGYRHSALMETGGVVLSAEFHLKPGNRSEISALMSDLNQRRREKQPLQYPSCGSFFKRPAGHYAGALIQEAGLKGYTVGDAQVSELHAGFVINRGHATARQIYDLMRNVQKTVLERSGVALEPEVRLIGRFES
ncbi:MAG: UDP-N-acetylmuramate dehydrogenase [Clostridia bacterium]|nr:UDP-N-acetylmuramate dehydrogenase [Clostridia bacterium]